MREEGYTMHAIYELKDKLCDELEEYGEKKLDAGSLDVIDKLAHTIKNIDKIIEKYEDDEYSERYAMEGGSYQRGGNRGGQGNRGGYSREMAYNDGMMDGSYARGRGRNARRDSMGRYSRADGNEMMVQELRDLMQEAPDERTKMEFKKFIQKMEQM